MYELIKLTENTYYIDCPAKIGVYVSSGGQAYLIDSGNDRSAAKKALKHITDNGWTLRAVVNTHSHADHIGGNAYLQAQTGCKIFAKGLECAYTNHTILEPTLLWGSNPPERLKHKFIYAKSSSALEVSHSDFPRELDIIDLPGHCYEMIAIRTPDNIVFAGDCVSSEQTLEKYKIGYIFDVEAYLDSLDKIAGIEAKMFVPSHTQPVGSMAELCAHNRKSVMKTCEDVAALLCEAKGFDELLSGIFELYGLTMTFEQHALVGCTIKAYLTYLEKTGVIEAFIDVATLKWKRR